VDSAAPSGTVWPGWENHKIGERGGCLVVAAARIKKKKKKGTLAYRETQGTIRTY